MLLCCASQSRECWNQKRWEPEYGSSIEWCLVVSSLVVKRENNDWLCWDLHCTSYIRVIGSMPCTGRVFDSLPCWDRSKHHQRHHGSPVAESWQGYQQIQIPTFFRVGIDLGLICPSWGTVKIRFVFPGLYSTYLRWRPETLLCYFSLLSGWWEWW